MANPPNQDPPESPAWQRDLLARLGRDVPSPPDPPAAGPTQLRPLPPTGQVPDRPVPPAGPVPPAHVAAPAAPAPAAATPLAFNALNDPRQHPAYRSLSQRRGKQRLAWLRGAGSVVGTDDLPRRYAAAAQSVQVPLNLPRRMLVVGAAGGAGATTTAVLLARVLAALRADRTLLVAGGQDLGALAARVGVPHGTTTAGVLAHLDRQPTLSPDALPQLLPSPGQNLWVVPSGGGPRAETVDVTHRLGRLCATAVVDGSRDDALDAGDFHSVVLVVPSTVTGVAAGFRLAEAIGAGLGPHRLTVVVNEGAAADGPPADLQAEAFVRAGCQRVHLLPADRHLAGGATIAPDLLSEAAKLVAAEITASALSAATAAGWRRQDQGPTP